MHITSAGRDAFLDFLRNLTPQAFLAAADIFVLATVKQPWRSWANAGYLALAVALGAIVLLAVSANTSRFLDQAFSQSKWGRRSMKVIKSRHGGAARRSVAFLDSALRRRPILFVEFVVAVCVMYASLFAVLIMATNTARSVLGKR